jgi:hypothetical protein
MKSTYLLHLAGRDEMGSINVRVMYGVAVRVGAEFENLMPFFVQSAYA